jgi:L-2,4-diaminobutyrate decarboxylase
MSMHQQDGADEELTAAIVRTVRARMRPDPPLNGPRSAADLHALAGTTITEHGLGALEALRIHNEVLAPACLSIDNRRAWAFVPGAPNEAARLFDLVVGASSVYAGSWMEGAGAIVAENETLRWIADLAGLPAAAGGMFVPGGSYGNLSALIVARQRWRVRNPSRAAVRPLVAVSSSAHSSIGAALRVMDAELLQVPAAARGRFEGAQLRSAIAALPAPERSRLCAVAATAGSTNAGVVDDFAGIAAVCREHDLWLHVDGAYGAAALAAPSVRALFDGIEQADSLIVDPHKWLFAPFDSCALVYRDPLEARRAHVQKAEYLEVLHADEEWNASDFGFGLSRRARGLPLWFALAAHGTAAYTRAIEGTLALTRDVARLLRRDPRFHLMHEPDLSVVLFRRRGWNSEHYDAWSRRLLAEGTAFVMPTRWQDETVMRFCFINPRTTLGDVRDVLETMGD